MLIILLFFIISNMIYCEQKFILSVKEPIMENKANYIPLIIKPTETVSEEIEIQCNGKIRYDPPGETGGNDLWDVSPKVKIPAGTSAGTEIEFMCYEDSYDSEIFENIIITFQLDRSLTDWSFDPQKKTIQFIPKFSAKPTVSNSKKLAQNDKFNIDINVMSTVTTDVSIEDGTFILKNGDTSINLIECDKIPNQTTKGVITISCKVAEEVKENKYDLILGDNKKIDGIIPLVSGETSFSGEDKNSSSSNSQDKNSSSSNSQDKNSSSSNSQDKNSSSSNNCNFIWELMIIALVLLF